MCMTPAMNNEISNITINDIHAAPGQWIGPPDTNGISASEEFHPSAFDSESEDEIDDENDN